MKLSAAAKLSVRANFSVPHLMAAARFSRHVASTEKTNQGQAFGSFWDEILAFSTASVFASVASLEAYANELFVDHEKHFPDMRTNLMKKIWEFFEQKALLEKYEFALLLRNAQGFEKGARPFQDTDALIRLRNALTHFKPEWDTEQVAHGKVSAQLQGRFPPSPFMGDGDPLFPKRWATAGCIKWAVESTLAFIRNFEELAGLEHRFEKFGDQLVVE